MLHTHPPYATALSLIEGGRLGLAHFNDLTLRDRIVYDDAMNGAVLDESEGDRIARLLGNRTTMIMGSHGLTTVGGTVADALLRDGWRGTLVHVADDRPQHGT